MVLFCEWLKELYPASAGPLVPFPAIQSMSYNQMPRPISNIWLTLVALLIHITVELSICVCRKYKRTFSLKSSPHLPSASRQLTRSQLLTPVCPCLPLILSVLPRSALCEVSQLSTGSFRGLWVIWGVRHPSGWWINPTYLSPLGIGGGTAAWAESLR